MAIDSKAITKKVFNWCKRFYDTTPMPEEPHSIAVHFDGVPLWIKRIIPEGRTLIRGFLKVGETEQILGKDYTWSEEKTLIRSLRRTAGGLTNCEIDFVETDDVSICVTAYVYDIGFTLDALHHRCRDVTYTLLSMKSITELRLQMDSLKEFMKAGTPSKKQDKMVQGKSVDKPPDEFYV